MSSPAQRVAVMQARMAQAGHEHPEDERGTPMFAPAAEPVRKVVRSLPSHSPRNAFTGSMRAARQAGHALAANATTVRPRLTATNVAGSVGGTP